MNIPFFDLKQQYKSIKPEIERAFSDIIDNTCFIGGDYVKDFEKKVADYLDVPFAVGCSNGTDALILGLRAAGVGPGDEVITTPFTFFATAEAIAAIGAVPVFIDVRQDDYNMDPGLIEAAITSRTKALLPVHIFGCPCEMDTIVEIAKRNGLKIVEDCAQAIGSTYKGRKTGTIGDVGAFSFYPTKNLGGAGDGGMVTTKDDHTNTILRALREHGSGKNGAEAAMYLNNIELGMDNILEETTQLYNPYKYFNYLIGYNSRLDAIQAAILSIKLDHLETYNERRRQIADLYLDGLVEKVKKPAYSESVSPCWHQFVIRTEYKKELVAYLAEHEIGSGTFYPVPLHKQKAFNKQNCANAGTKIPVAEMISEQSVCLPIYPELTDDQVTRVIDTVNSFFKDKQ